MDDQINLKNTVLNAPSESGVYIMKDGEGQIIYIGKAKSLKNRLKSYFSGEKDIKTATLMKHVRNIETIILANEYEALLLENTLIKQHSPKYNISLKDGKTYPVVRITHEDFPRIFKTRRIIQDESLYYGPFPNVQGINTMLELIDKLFPLRKCKKLKKKGPCMYYHINRCMAPCCGKISIEEYALHVQRVQKLLSGETDSLIIDLTEQMHNAARDLRFEQAAQIRNTIRSIESLTDDSAVEDMNPEDRDYIAWAGESVLATFTVFSMRGGKMTGRELFRARSAADEQESLETFITTYYDASRPPPLKIYLQRIITEDLARRRQAADAAILRAENAEDAEDAEEERGKNLIPDWFKATFNYEPELLLPTEKHHEAILAMARQNAAEDLRIRLKERGAGPALDELARALDLPSRPERIEGFDISHLGGRHPVASLISFKNGIPDKKNYRYFKLRTVIGVIDDFAAMREAAHRRYSRLLREGKELPDLILVDGGIGQANAAKGVLDDLGADCGVVGLAKREEELWLPAAKEPVILSKQSEALKVLQAVRDECHRFANSFNRRLRSKDLFFPILESVEGIGEKRAAAIMEAYETIANIAAAEPAEMAQRCNISEASARAVRACAKIALADRKNIS
uniref:UvrABC system protein C n=1 Tax=uncultured bacterium contig00204 TaxID=1181609 RepID=A0A806KLA4_9BACT|nr:excinuclease ABC subunit C [uncultured bacterium contig00204]